MRLAPASLTATLFLCRNLLETHARILSLSSQTSETCASIFFETTRFAHIPDCGLYPVAGTLKTPITPIRLSKQSRQRFYSRYTILWAGSRAQKVASRNSRPLLRRNNHLLLRAPKQVRTSRIVGIFPKAPCLYVLEIVSPTDDMSRSLCSVLESTLPYGLLEIHCTRHQAMLMNT